MLQCCICGRPLPNRYAVAGKCEDDGCESVFCSLHWNNGNHHCGKHGWKPDGLLNDEPAAAEPDPPAPPRKEVVFIDGEGQKMEEKDEPAKEASQSEQTLRERAKKFLTKEQAAGILHSVAEFAGKLGKSTVGLATKIKNANSPETVLASIDTSLEANRAQRAPLMERADKLFAEITAKKKVYQAAPPAKKKLLELELRSLLSEYKGLERQMTAFFENENTLNTVRGRVLELMALGMRKIDEATIDKLTDKIEDAVGEAEDVSGAVRDLDKAGKRRDNESDQDAFESALAGFDDEGAEFSAADSAASNAETPDPFVVDPPVHSAEEAAKTPVPEEP